MITLVKSEKCKITSDSVTILGEFRGLSTDTKPSTYDSQKIENGSLFIEIDTGNVYMYDLENHEWRMI